MALLAIQDLSDGGIPTFVAANGGGDTMPQGVRAAGWDQGVLLVIKNTDVATKTVTVTGMAPVVVPVTNGIGIIPVYGGVGGTVRAIAYSAVTGVTVAAVRMAGD